MWNIHADMLPDTKLHSLKQHIMRLRPRAVLILNNPGYAIEVKRAVPNTNVIYRKWIDPAGDNTGDNNLHLKFGAREMNNIYRAEIPVSEGVVYHYGNEPGTGDDLFEWSNEAAIYTVETKAYGCYLNFSPGVPEPFDWRKPSALKFLRTIASNRQRHIVGLHEYMPSVNWWEFGFTQNPASWANKVNGKSWLMGRYRDLLAACDENRIPRPRIVMTEHGFDYIPASASFQNNLPVAPECRNRQPPEKAGALWCNTEYWQQILPAGYTWPQYMVEMLHWVHRAIYRWDAEIEGVCNYCYGAQGGSRWEMYDHSRLPNIFELMESKDWTMATTTPTPTPQPTPHTGRALFWINANGDGVGNIRSTPSTERKEIGGIGGIGVLAKRLASIQMTDGVWYQYRFADNTSGWVRSDVHKAVELTKSVGLQVPYKSQWDIPDADAHLNDCGVAALASLMAFAGVNKTVDEVSVKAGLIGANLTDFADMVRAAKAYTFEAVARQNMQLSDILASLLKGYPVASLINYDALKPGRVIGHFVVPVGFHVNEDAFSLDVIVHDPNDKAFVSYPAAKIAQAIATTNVNGNNKFQSLVITNWDKFPTPGTQPPSPIPSELEKAVTAIMDKAQQDIMVLVNALLETEGI